MSDDAKRSRWWDTKHRAWSGFTGLPNRLIDSPAFAALSSAAAVRTFCWFYQEAKYEKVKKRPGMDSPIGKVDKITNNGEISFTYQVAGWRGMNPRRFARVLKELHRLGFIDVAKLGRGVMGAYTKFSLSNRWQRYGTPEWKEIPFPENFREGFREKKNNGHKRPLPTDTNVRYKVVKSPDNGHERPLKTAATAHFQRTPTSVSQDLAMPIGPDRKVEDQGLKGQGVDRAPSRRGKEN